MITYVAEDDSESLTFGDVNIDAEIRERTGSEGIRRYAVYWLECHPPGFEYRDPDERQVVLEELHSLLGTSQVPSWLDSALRSENLHYVGYSSSLSSRINAHIRGDGSEFCRLFPPHALRDVWWYDSKQEARLAEQTIAAEIRQGTDNGYVFQF